VGGDDLLLPTPTLVLEEPTVKTALTGYQLLSRTEDLMKPVANRCRVTLLGIALALGCVYAESSGAWFQKRVTWQAGSDPQPWETMVAGPTGKEHYRLALIPLWAVEGGIVAIEILVAHPEHPGDNLLGRRDTDAPQPFVITVEELESGINKSRFGATRVFKVGQAKLHVKIQGSRLGEGVGECSSCKNIQEFTAELVFGNR
jgi:hypothetical protein